MPCIARTEQVTMLRKSLANPHGARTSIRAAQRISSCIYRPGMHVRSVYTRWRLSKRTPGLVGYTQRVLRSWTDGTSGSEDDGWRSYDDFRSQWKAYSLQQLNVEIETLIEVHHHHRHERSPQTQSPRIPTDPSWAESSSAATY